MAQDPCVLKEDGYLSVDSTPQNIVYHPTLNIVLIVSRNGRVDVLDVNSGVLLHKSCLSAEPDADVVCKYLVGPDRVLFSDGHGVGVRSDYNGVLLLDTVLQKPVTSSKDVVKLELLLSEAIILKQSLTSMSSTVEQQTEVIAELSAKILEATAQGKKSIKGQKWNTVCLELPLDVLRTVAVNNVADLMMRNQRTQELAVAAAVQDRLSELINEPLSPNDRSAMASEAKRRETFARWPHMDYKWALPDQMAQAGFYHQPSSSGDDRAMCFTCTVCLVCWERTDEPWSEHERHSPNCPFVVGEYTQNVPLSVTYATSPAVDAVFKGCAVKVVGTSSVPELVPTANTDRLIAIYDVSGKLKRTHCFYVTQYDSPILEKFVLDFGQHHAWEDPLEDDNVKVNAVCIVGDRTSSGKPKSSAHIRPSIICGVTIRCRPAIGSHLQRLRFLNTHNLQDGHVSDVDWNTVLNPSTALYLSVYDFRYQRSDSQESDRVTEASDPTDPQDKDNSSIVDYNKFAILKPDQVKSAYNYQNLIPGESDEIYLPPPTNASHSGTRALSLEDQISDPVEDTDASSSLVATYKNLMGLCDLGLDDLMDTAPPLTEKSISDHIAEMKLCKSRRLNYSHAVQCVPLPEQYRIRQDLDIFEIAPTTDAGHILVVLTSGASQSCVLFVYKLNFNSKVVKIIEDPILTKEMAFKPTEITVLPSLDKTTVAKEEKETPMSSFRDKVEGVVMFVCDDGLVRLIELSALKVVSVAKHDTEKFVSAAYCNSLERLCAATEKGTLHFYALNDIDMDSMDCNEDDECVSLVTDAVASPMNNVAGNSANSGHYFQDSSKVSMQDLRSMHSLCAFEPLGVGYCAVVPSCWSEMQQAQRQRRHPQSQHGDDNHTRTWRLQTDTTTWDEHVFELTLPWSVCIGYVEVRFALHSQTQNAPNVEVTLLRQKPTGIGHRRDVCFPVDEQVTFDLLQKSQNPVVSEEYLRAHNAEILAGPINLAGCLDLTEQSGCVMLTSPKLLKTRTRTMLLHIKALCDISRDQSRKEKKGRSDSLPGTASERASSRKSEHTGCDCFHELSVTIRGPHSPDIPHENSIRLSMLESNNLLESLLKTAEDRSSILRQTLALDILVWIVSIRLARNKSSNGDSPTQQSICLEIIESHLPQLLKQCVLSSGRTVSHKCVKLLVVCCDGSRNVSSSIGNVFDTKVLQSVLNCLPSIGSIWSAGSLHWLIILLLHVAKTGSCSLLISQCITLLHQVSEELHSRTNLYHLLLRTRFGLFGTPLELELFDVDPPPPAKPSSVPMTYAFVVSGEGSSLSNYQPSYIANNENLDPKEVLSAPGSDAKVRMRNMAPNKYMRGLLETEPLHFVCISASDGTRIERFEPGSQQTNMSSFFGPLSVSAIQQQNSGTKKAESDDTKDKENPSAACANEYLESQMLQASGGIEPVKLTQLLIDSEVPSVHTTLLQLHNKIGHDLSNVLKSFASSQFKNACNEFDMLEMSIESEGSSNSDVQQTRTAFRNDDGGSNLSPSGMLWQQLLLAPAQQMMVVDRMQSGARRFVTLDFGSPVLLTDVLIPACSDLVSLSVDLWLRNEDADAVRLVVSPDIGSKCLVLSDLQPPPLCRYIKITTIGRYGMSTTRSKIPVGNFYGHVIVLPDEVPPDQPSLADICNVDLEAQMNVLSMLFEDVSCRYSLACTRLKDLLESLLSSDIPNSIHMATYLGIMRDSAEQQTISQENMKVFTAYQEAMTYQRQLNVVRGVMRRIEKSLGKSDPYVCNQKLTDACTDKLRAVAENLLDVLLSVPLEKEQSSSIGRQMCEQLFQGLCVTQGPRLQMLAATLLVRLCGRESYWGPFLADTLARMFSSRYAQKFPQDRVFVLLVYLGRKSPDRSIIIDSTLRVIAEVLSPLSRPQWSLLAVGIDLSLLGWLLLFLSQQLDSSGLQPATRWNWITGETKNTADSAGSGSYKRKMYRRFLHYKQQLDQIDWTPKAMPVAQVQALSALSAAKYTTKLEAALKQQELNIKKAKHKLKNTLKQAEGGSPSPKSTRRHRESPPDAAPVPEFKVAAAQLVNMEHCVCVARALGALLLAMDHSCSTDLFLLSCKVVARLVTIARVSIYQIFTPDQLQHLMRLYVTCDQAWTQHALSCLFQDMLGVSKVSPAGVGEQYDAATEMDTDSQPPGPSWGPTDTDIFLDSLDSLIEDRGSKTKISILPCVNESDDSELDEYLDDILERGRSVLRRSASMKGNGQNNGAISSALDARMELGMEMASEITLRRLTALSMHNLVQSLSSSSTIDVNSINLPDWPEELIDPWTASASQIVLNHGMLSVCFANLFKELQMQSASYMENTLKLWLNLNSNLSAGCFDPSTVPTITLCPQSVSSLVSALAWKNGLSLRIWCLSLQTLTLVCNLPSVSPPASDDWLEHSLNGMATCLINHQDFVQMLFRLVSGNGFVFSDKGLAGPSVCRSLHELLIRLQMRCDVVTASSKPGAQLKELLLKLVYQMVQPIGPLSNHQGPLDVQCKLLQILLHLDFTNTDLGIVMSIVENTGVLVHSYVTNVERIKCVNLGEKTSANSHNFSGLFASVLGVDMKQERPPSWDTLLISLLKLLSRLVSTPLLTSQDSIETAEARSAQSAQTDESKAEQRQQDGGSRPSPIQPVPCLADTVLQHHPSILRLCHSLAACSSSSLVMLAGCTPTTGLLTDIGEPTCVGDGVYQLLAALSQKTSRPALMLDPLLLFLSSTRELSEPLLWFVLQVLNNEEALRGFLDLGGVRTLGECLVRSGRTLSIVQHGTISLVMQHLASAGPSRTDANLNYAAPGTKKTQQANMESSEALINYAPFGSIRCHSGTAQPADILIQTSVAPHRRARTPQWSYHFYPDESHTDLTISLPSAILLREVQLQPHLSSLATCPSAVAIEVSSDGPAHLVPACPPVATSGMTFIRFHLPVPEVVRCVLLRLYRPRDASNIGLSQIRLMGTSAFGGPARNQDPNDEETFSKFSLGWLRLLHHCFTLPKSGTELEQDVVESASRVQDLLVTCCGLLLVPTHIPTLYLPNLEKVLCKLSLRSRQSGLLAIKILLENRPSTDSIPTVGQGTWFNKVQVQFSSPAVQSVCELLHRICEHQDQDTAFRVTAILQWLHNTAEEAVLSGMVSSEFCSPAYVSCIASVLWSARGDRLLYDLHSMITVDLFNSIHAWSAIVHNNIALKHALDCLLCSLCYIKSEMFPLLLQRVGVLVPNLSTDHAASISDDRKDQESMTDDNKQNFDQDSEWYDRLVIGKLSDLSLTEYQLRTIGMVSRSPPAVQQLLDSGLPKLLTGAILEFCSSNVNGAPLAKLDSVTSVLTFLADVCAEETMRDWLGSPEGSSFWLPLLLLLCNKPAGETHSMLRSEGHTRLEEVYIRFLSRCCLCHPGNQKLLATVLCEVIGQQKNGISGFLRRLILQLLLENEKVPVCIKADEAIYKIYPVPQPDMLIHPSFKRTHDRILLYLSTNHTLGDIVDQHIAFATVIKMDSKQFDVKYKESPQGPPVLPSGQNKEVWEVVVEASENIMAAAATAKDKRAKDVKNQGIVSATPQLKKKRYTTGDVATSTVEGLLGHTIRCESFPERSLPLGMSLAQILALMKSGRPADDYPCIHLSVLHGKDDKTSKTESDVLLKQPPIGNALQAFSSMGGLALLAQHLPAIYPETLRPPSREKQQPPASAAEQAENEWVKLDGSDDVYEILDDDAGPSVSAKAVVTTSNVPPHSLTAFGLFLRLPGYAEVLLKDMKKSLCLLRLVLGVTDDGEGGDIFSSSVADSLPTLPFEVLRKLYDVTPLSTDDGRLLRRISINIGVTHLLFACLAIFTHQTQPNGGEKGGENRNRVDDKGQLYWAKGTGYGTGSTQQSWNVEQALLRQRSEEEHVTVLLQVLASYINPNGEAVDELSEAVLPPTFCHLLANSCLLPALSSYLRNDSVLDMARHIPLYRGVLQLLRALAVSSQLISLLLPQSKEKNSPSIVELLKKMKTCVDNYAYRLKFNKVTSTKSKLTKFAEGEDADTDEGLALLMPDIQETANLVHQATERLVGSEENDSGSHESTFIEHPLQKSLDQRYIDIMRHLQFDTYEMIAECPEGGYKFTVSYHFESNVKNAGDQSQPARMKRLAQEAVTLATSLPLSYSSSVFVRCDADRLDIMKVLITGPADTPYANGCFELDVFFPPDYPNSPMMINLETTGHHTVRFNPNLYNDGKVCLSVLNTWHGRPEEKWNAQTSSFLQVLVSIQSLILVSEPYFNEPGYERSRGTPSGTQNSKEYNTNVSMATVRWAMLEQVINPCPCFKEVIHTHFWLKRQEVLAQVEGWIGDMEVQLAEKRSGRSTNKRTTLTGLETFKKNYQQLREQLMKLPPPAGMEETDTGQDVVVVSAAASASVSAPLEFDAVEEEEAVQLVPNGFEPTLADVEADIDMEKMVSDMCE